MKAHEQLVQDLHDMCTVARGAVDSERGDDQAGRPSLTVLRVMK